MEYLGLRVAVECNPGVQLLMFEFIIGGIVGELSTQDIIYRTTQVEGSAMAK